MPVDVIVATSPGRAADLMSQDLQALKPALLYADTITLLSPAAHMAFGVLAEIAIEDTMQRILYLQQMAEAAGQPFGLSEEVLEGLTRWLAMDAAANRSTRRQMRRSPEYRTMRALIDGLDDQWTELQKQAYEVLVAGKAAEEMVPASPKPRRRPASRLLGGPRTAPRLHRSASGLQSRAVGLPVRRWPLAAQA